MSLYACTSREYTPENATLLCAAEEPDIAMLFDETGAFGERDGSVLNEVEITTAKIGDWLDIEKACEALGIEIYEDDDPEEGRMLRDDAEPIQLLWRDEVRLKLEEMGFTGIKAYVVITNFEKELTMLWRPETYALKPVPSQDHLRTANSPAAAP